MMMFVAWKHRLRRLSILYEIANKLGLQYCGQYRTGGQLRTTSPPHGPMNGRTNGWKGGSTEGRTDRPKPKGARVR